MGRTSKEERYGRDYYADNEPDDYRPNYSYEPAVKEESLEELLIGGGAFIGLIASIGMSVHLWKNYPVMEYIEKHSAAAFLPLIPVLIGAGIGAYIASISKKTT